MGSAVAKPGMGCVLGISVAVGLNKICSVMWAGGALLPLEQSLCPGLQGSTSPPTACCARCAASRRLDTVRFHNELTLGMYVLEWWERTAVHLISLAGLVRRPPAAASAARMLRCPCFKKACVSNSVCTWLIRTMPPRFWRGLFAMPASGRCAQSSLALPAAPFRAGWVAVVVSLYQPSSRYRSSPCAHSQLHAAFFSSSDPISTPFHGTAVLYSVTPPQFSSLVP